MNKYDEMQNWIESNKPAVVALTETWLKNDISDSEVSPTGYTTFRCDRHEGRKGGGVCLLIRADIPVTQLKAFAAPDGQYESLWCKVKLTKRGFDTIGVVYRPPATDGSQLLNELQEFSQLGHCLILGDFNAHGIDWSLQTCNADADTFSKLLCDASNELGLFQHVFEPTRMLGNQFSTLDLILSSNQLDVDNLEYLPPIGKSDHMVLTFRWMRDALPTPTILQKPNIWKIDFEQLKQAAQNETWIPDPTMDVETLWHHIKTTLDKLVCMYAPKHTQRPHHRGPPWFDKELLKTLKLRNKAWKHYRLTGEGFSYYKKLRNNCSYLKRLKRQAFEQKLAQDAATAPKRLYAYMRRRTNVRSIVPTLITGGGNFGITIRKSHHLSAAIRISVCTRSK
jgi:endonuclease/exonuclease/phosphatase family metal-dependent hydrolase